MVEMEDGSVRKESGKYDISLFNARYISTANFCEVVNVIMMS